MLDPAVVEARRAVTEHPLLGRALSPAQARVFMSHHVFAVWDFMSLLKRLQRELTCISLPWRPPANRRWARLMNEIVLAEESDVDGLGEYASHFEIYLDAMREVDADVRPIEQLQVALARGVGVDAALDGCGAPQAARDFTRHTLALALDPASSAVAVAAAFLHGREAIIPRMFEQLLAAIEGHGGSAARLRYYLARHVEVDGDSHGPLAARLLDEMTEAPADRRIAVASALSALEARRRLWDALDLELTTSQRPASRETTSRAAAAWASRVDRD